MSTILIDVLLYDRFMIYLLIFIQGVLPYKLLDLKNKEYVAKSLLVNAKQIEKQVKANRQLTVGDNLVNMHYKDKEFQEKVIIIEKLLMKGKYEEAVIAIEYLINLAKENLAYYRRYQTNRFLFCLVLMWIGWIILLYTNLSGVPRRSIKLGSCSCLQVANITLSICLIPLIVEYFGKTSGN